MAALIQLALASMALGAMGAAHAADGAGAARPAAGPISASFVEFNGAFLRGSSENAVDVKRFALGNPLFSGSYRVEATFNGEWLGKLEVSLVKNPATGQVDVCLDRALIRRLGIDVAKASPKVQAFMAEKGRDPSGDGASQCLFAADIDAAARAEFDSAELKLALSIPQFLVSRRARGYVSPEAWDPGVRAVALDYQLSGFHTKTRTKEGVVSKASTAFAGVALRANLGDGWQFTHMGSLRSSSESGSSYTSTGSYLSHDIPSWLSSVRIGNANTGGQLFDSVAFRGVRVSSDERMLPDSMRGYAPVIRGQARGNAVVTVKQNGVLLREVVVPAGAFEIDDLFPPGFGGDLVVTVTEADGAQTTSIVPFTAGPEVLREGQWRHDVAVGQLTGARLGNRPGFVLGTLQYGFSNDVTGAVGATAMSRYGALLFGGAVNTRLGSLGLNATFSRFQSSNAGTLVGSSYSASYAVAMPASRTNFSFVAYRYSTQNYMSVSDAEMALDGLVLPSPYKVKNRSVATVNQMLDDRSQLYLNGTYQTYWAGTRHDLNFNVGYSLWFKSMQFTVSAGRSSYNGAAAATSIYSVGLVIPLGGVGSTGTVSTNYQHDKLYGNTAQLTAGGAFGERREYGYSVSAIKSGQSSPSLSASASWRASAGSVAASVGKSSNGSQQSLSVVGGLVLHAGGVSVAPSVGETYALVDARGASGANVMTGMNVTVDRNGYAIVPYLSPYQLNNIDLDLRNVSLDVELESTSAQVAPRAGAAVLVKFKSRQGVPALIDLTPDKGSIPLGASITDLQGVTVGVVGQGGVGEIRVKETQGRLRASWGDGANQSCDFDYVLGEKPAGQPFSRSAAKCRMASL
ncbi:MAG: fimbrial biogenesis outer membrane usher protein [Pelomonas sp.]|nr:fimbrial biogenesis outer membrane usher protein [Roseateles sp.]